ncbi:hypothetical protein FAI40_04465 [Acetobacteraceae bacterium]|nr:hypothetical protein FAI40_04465 [Acetobacteraceae bacterium]
MENTPQNTENEEEDLDDTKETEWENTPSSLPSELIPLVSAHLKVAGLPDAFISQIHKTALGKNFKEPPTSQETEDSATSGKKKNSAPKADCASDTALEDDETRLERVFSVSRHK